MSITIDAVAAAQAKLDANAIRLSELSAQRATALDALGAATATGHVTANHRKALRALDEDIESCTAALPHLERALADVMAERDAAIAALKRQRLTELAKERRAYAADIDAAIASLQHLLTHSAGLARESHRLSRELRLRNADAIVANRTTALGHNLAFHLTTLAGRELPSTIVPGYARPFAQVENELLVHEED